jgi:ribose transport system permease protein
MLGNAQLAPNSSRTSSEDRDESDPSGVRRARRSLIGSELIGIAVPTVLLAVAMTIAFPGFSRPFNVEALLVTIGVTAVVGLSQLSVLTIGQFNLALPAIGAFAGMLVAWLLQVAGFDWPLAVIVALVFASLLGLIQGAMIAVLRLNAFIVTLGLAAAYTGLMFVTLGNARYQEIGDVLPQFGRGGLGPLPNVFIMSLVTATVVWVLVQRTVVGRHLLATGAGPLVARFSAVPVDRTVVIAHSLSGALGGVAAILVVSRLAVGSPAIGADWLLTSFAAPVLGGTILTGGRVSIVGTVLGAALLALIANALVIAGISQFLYQAGLGLIVLGAVAIAQVRLRLLSSRSR